jgi:UDP-N-acetyl-D-glucosamine/UDP-N-acetyl-D-galactosamine dehydrogenase
LAYEAREAAAGGGKVEMSERGFAVVGLGYVGLPVALALAQQFDPVWGFDIAASRIAELAEGRDRTREVAPEALRQSRLRLTSTVADLAGASFFIVTVPTPIDSERRPDLGPIREACRLIGQALRPGAVVVFESTVYPGLTRELCGPLLAASSGLRQGADFTLGYSPERINPGDRVHRLETITKVVAGEDTATLERVAAVYGRLVPAGIHRAASLEVAEAAKVIENTQRDLNIALMNELALIFDRLGIATADVLKAAGTKWNFLPFTPGLVGGHCIGVDPYYLTARAEAAGYYPQVILSGRRINDGMGAFVAQRLIKLLIAAERPIKGARVGILGLTFKEDVPDLRNSRVPDIIAELRGFGIAPIVHDPMADAAEALHEYGVALVGAERFAGLDGVIYAVPHQSFKARGGGFPFAMLAPGGVLVDVKSALDRAAVPHGFTYWAL